MASITLTIIFFAKSTKLIIYKNIENNLEVEKSELNNKKDEAKIGIFFTNNEVQKEEKISEDTLNNKIIKENIGYLTIPEISLEKAPIKEGTKQEILSEAIGHFTNTNIYSGNIGLASHNSGGKGDYFKKLKDIKIGSKIYYQTPYGTKEYIVQTKEEIEETDLTYLRETEDNRITLITCVKDKRNKRLCVQAIEM